MQPHIRGRRRSLDQQKKAEICNRVAQGASVEEAAEDLDVSLRTVQREAKEDDDFHHELRLAQRQTPDPLKIMQSAARDHWRAAAWLLERTDPEQYARRPASSASAHQFEAALRVVIEAALQATPTQRRAEVYEYVQAAADMAFTQVFPKYGPWGQPLRIVSPPTPLADQEHIAQICEPSRGRHVLDYSDEDAPRALLAVNGPSSASNSTPTDGRILSPKTCFATEFRPPDQGTPASTHSATSDEPVK